ncbi:MAG: molecular chaperone TorD family protein [Coriobacteriales bacterium]|jgi:TorA maturation chaperone TorD|nr:molecular chaperone TorD family protein [Coriobacteriales bacterium]
MIEHEAARVPLVNRYYLYTLFGRALNHEPDEALLDALGSRHTRDALAVAQLLEDADRDVPAPFAALPSPQEAKSDYTKLLIGPDRLPVSPWESVHVTGDDLLFQKHTLEVREAYRQAGFRTAGRKAQPDDHIATELDFLAALAHRAYEAAEATDDALLASALGASQAFLKEHLLQWVDAFATGVAAATLATCLYPQIAELVARFARCDLRFVEGLLGQLRKTDE